MNPPPESQPRQRRYRARLQTRLDAEIHAQLEALARMFRRKRAAILRSVMPWGLAHTQEWTVDRPIPDRPHLVHMLVDRDLLQHVQAAVEAHGASIAAGLRHAMRQVTPGISRLVGAREGRPPGRMIPVLTSAVSCCAWMMRRRAS